MYKTENEVKYKLLEQHYKKNYELLVGRANRLLGTMWAEDAVHDAYAQCLRYIRSIPLEIVEVNYYVHTVLRNVIARYRYSNFSPVEIKEDMLESGELADSARAVGVLDEIRNHLKTMPEKQRGVLYARLFLGESITNVSKVFGVSPIAVDMMVFKFRKVIKDDYEI